MNNNTETGTRPVLLQLGSITYRIQIPDDGPLPLVIRHHSDYFARDYAYPHEPLYVEDSYAVVDLDALREQKDDRW